MVTRVDWKEIQTDKGPVIYKKCIRCQTMHPLSDYYPARDSKWKRSNVCRFCCRTRAKESAKKKRKLDLEIEAIKLRYKIYG